MHSSCAGVPLATRASTTTQSPQASRHPAWAHPPWCTPCPLPYHTCSTCPCSTHPCRGACLPCSSTWLRWATMPLLATLLHRGSGTSRRLAWQQSELQDLHRGQEARKGVKGRLAAGQAMLGLLGSSVRHDRCLGARAATLMQRASSVGRATRSRSWCSIAEETRINHKTFRC